MFSCTDWDLPVAELLRAGLLSDRVLHIDHCARELTAEDRRVLHNFQRYVELALTQAGVGLLNRALTERSYEYAMVLSAMSGACASGSGVFSTALPKAKKEIDRVLEANKLNPEEFGVARKLARALRASASLELGRRRNSKGG